MKGRHQELALALMSLAFEQDNAMLTEEDSENLIASPSTQLLWFSRKNSF
jgi:hypothetical protein